MVIRFIPKWKHPSIQCNATSKNYSANQLCKLGLFSRILPKKKPKLERKNKLDLREEIMVEDNKQIELHT